MLPIFVALAADLRRQGVRYCHWKKNATLEENLEGNGDVDLLLDEGQRPLFEDVLRSLGFKPAAPVGRAERAAYNYFFGLDGCTGTLVHLDVYTEVLSGGSLLKTHAIPLKPMIFENLDRNLLMPVPSRGAELLVFVIRKLLASTSLLEQIVLYREYGDVKREIDWLATDEAVAEARSLLARYLPDVDAALVQSGIHALRSRSAFLERWRLGRRLDRTLARYRIRSPWAAALLRAFRLAGRAYRGLSAEPHPLGIAPRGAVIAVVGPDSSGKSTVVRRLGDWLNGNIANSTARTGSPPTTPVTILPKKLAHLSRRVWRSLPLHARASQEPAAPTQGAADGSVGLYLDLGRALILAYDRARLLARLTRLALAGVVVITDRYPVPELGGVVDGSQLDPCALAGGGHHFASWLARLENQLYQHLPPPDMVVRLNVSLEVALQRNAARTIETGRDPDEHVRARHAASGRVAIPRSRSFEIDADRSSEDVLLDVKRAIWAGL